MAVSFDVCVSSRIRMILSMWTLVLVLGALIGPVDCRRHKHPPVVAFFQGHCEHNFCDQLCRDIDNGGYACECYRGYRLNQDGITCSKLSSDGDVVVLTQNEIERPDVVHVITHSEETNSLKTVVEHPLQGEVTHSEETNSLKTVVEHSLQGEVTHSQEKNSLNTVVEHPLQVEASPHHSVDNVDIAKNVDIELPKHSHTNDLKSEQSLTTEATKDKVLIGHGELKAEPIKIVTYDYKSEAPKLETDSLRSSETSHEENLQNLVPNLPSKFRTVSKVKSSVRGVKCDEFSCLNNGKCVDDGTVYRNKVRCDCLLGTIGERCEKEVEVRYPRFYGNSFVALPVLKNGYKELDLLIEFKPTAQYGLLVFSSEFEDARSDFFSIALIDGYIEFRYDCGTGMGVVRSLSQVVIDQWNILKVQRIDNLASIFLNNDDPVQGTSKGSYSRLTLRLNLYIGGYNAMASIGDKVGTEKGFLGCVEQVKVNGYKYDLRKAQLVGDAQFGANVGECSEGVCDTAMCLNGGRCQVVSAESHVCLCPLGTGGENCQHHMDVHIPEFRGHSYLEYPGLDRTALLFLEIELTIKPTKHDGLILYNGYTLDRAGDFISLQLDGGHLVFLFDLGTGPAILRSPEPLALNHWHWIKLSRTGMEGILEVDGVRVAIGQSQGAFTQLTLTQNLYIGGHRNYDETSRLANVSKSFDGCIQKLVINNRQVWLVEDASYGVNVESCEHPCVGQPCLNGGQCNPRKDVYTCYCPLGFSSHNCQRRVDKDITSPRFSSESFLMYTQKNVAKRIGGNKIDLRFTMKPEAPNGVVFWSGPDVMLATSDYIAVGFVNGALQFRYNLGSGEAVISYNNSRLFDGMWHYIHIQRDKQDGFMSVDGREIVEGSSKGSYTMLNTNNVLYIGGMPDVPQGTLRKFSSGFLGCIQDLVLGEDYSLQLLQSAESGRNIVACS